MNCKDLLNSLYELEGLVMLCIKRPEKAAELQSLIIEKIKGLQLPESTPVEEELPLPSAEPEVKPEIELPVYSLEDEDSAADVEEESPRYRSDIHVIKGSCRPVFSLNDKFLFIRELFGGDAGAFKDAIERLGTLETQEEIERYLNDTLHINTEGGEGERFLDILTGSLRN